MSLSRYLLPPSDGTRYRQLALDLDERGGLTLTDHERGASLEAVWGADDREVTVRVDGDALGRLAQALLIERLGGRTDGLALFLAFCEAHDIEHETACWT
jgi:hypothetical protein